MPITDLLPFLGMRKLFDPTAYDPSIISDDPMHGGITGNEPIPNQNPSGGLDDNVAQITKMLLDKLNAPNPNVDRLNQLYNDFPTRTSPSLLRRLAAGLTGVGAGPVAAKNVLEGDFNNKLNDWVLKNKAAESIANTDIRDQQSETSNAIRSIGTAVANQREKDTAATALQNANTRVQQIQNNLDLTNSKLELARTVAENNKNNQEAQRQLQKLTIDSLNLQRQLDNELHRNQLAEVVRQHDQRFKEVEDAAKNKGWDTINIPDPNKAGAFIPVRVNKTTGAVERLKLDDENISGAAQKLGTGSGASSGGLTTQTKAMMEGSQMLYPHIAEIRKQAQDLERRGLFGPIMSRVRDLGAKVGTVGDPGDVEKNFNNFSQALTSDPKLNPSGDAAVGQFLTTLGLLASGAGRVHGGARGGGSIQMVNYMKSLLSSDATLSMFNGRLNALDSFIKGYAAGPAKPADKTKLDSIIDDILSGKK